MDQLSSIYLAAGCSHSSLQPLFHLPNRRKTRAVLRESFCRFFGGLFRSLNWAPSNEPVPTRSHCERYALAAYIMHMH